MTFKMPHGKLIFLPVFVVFSSFLFFGISVSTVYAADINYSLLSGSTVSQLPQAPGPTFSGSLSNIKDNNASTYYQIYRSFSCPLSPCGTNVSLSIIITFDSPVSLNKIEAVHRAQGSPNGGGNWQIELNTNGSYASIGNGALSNGVTGTTTVNGSWNNVSAVKITGSAVGSSPSGGPTFATAGYNLYELRAWGPESYIDCGLKIFDNAGTIKIACNPLGTLTSPLRIFKNGNIYSIALVETTDANASKIRIKTSSGIKALRKF